MLNADKALRLLHRLISGRGQACWWQGEWQEGEREVRADIEAGCVRRFKDVDEEAT